MFLYLVQHAEAKKEEEDPARGLSEKGLQDIKKVAAYAAELNIKASRIFHSGKTRALQTAQVLADSFKIEKGISETDGLAPVDDPQIWLERISKMNVEYHAGYSTVEDLVLVGHLPHLARLSALILCGDREKDIVDFKMGGIVCLKRFEVGIDSYRDGNWSVEWMIIPSVIK